STAEVTPAGRPSGPPRKGYRLASPVASSRAGFMAESGRLLEAPSASPSASAPPPTIARAARRGSSAPARRRALRAPAPHDRTARTARNIVQQNRNHARRETAGPERRPGSRKISHAGPREAAARRRPRARAYTGAGAMRRESAPEPPRRHAPHT